MSEASTKIRTFLVNTIGLNLDGVSDDTALFSSGLIDSLSLIELLSFIESELNSELDIADLDIDEIDTIGALAALAQ